MPRFLTLPPAERTVVVLAGIGLAAAPVMLRVCGTPRTIAALMDASHQPRLRHYLREVPSRRLGELVERVAAYLPWSTSCLHRALAQAWLLGQADRSCTVCLGVRAPAAGRFAAHSWVVNGDEPAPLAAGAYTPLHQWRFAARSSAR